MRKYTRRGWTLTEEFSEVPVPPDHNIYTPYFRIGDRFLGDGQTWKLDLDTQSIDSPSPISSPGRRLTTDPVAASSWVLKHNPPEDVDKWTTPLEFKFTPFRHLRLKYAYIGADDRVPRGVLIGPDVPADAMCALSLCSLCP